MLALLVTACGPADTGVARRVGQDILACEVTYRLSGLVEREAQARLVLDLDLSADGNSFVVKGLEANGDPAPWQVFGMGQRRPVADVTWVDTPIVGTGAGETVRAQQLVLWRSGPEDRGMTLNRLTGDLVWATALPGGEVEYVGGCVPQPR